MSIQFMRGLKAKVDVANIKDGQPVIVRRDDASPLLYIGTSNGTGTATQIAPDIDIYGNSSMVLDRKVDPISSANTPFAFTIQNHLYADSPVYKASAVIDFDVLGYHYGSQHGGHIKISADDDSVGRVLAMWAEPSLNPGVPSGGTIQGGAVLGTEAHPWYAIYGNFVVTNNINTGTNGGTLTISSNMYSTGKIQLSVQGIGATVDMDGVHPIGPSESLGTAEHSWSKMHLGDMVMQYNSDEEAIEFLAE